MTVVADQDVQQLLELARNKSQEGRRLLVATISDLFEASGETLTERERALMSDILNKLIRDFEMKVRRELSERLARRGHAPREVVLMLANDEIEVARPILLVSEVLHDQDLVEIIRHRTIQHQLAIAMRQHVSETVSDALVETGNSDVIKALLDNGNARVSTATMEYLVEESRRVDTYQEPLVRRSDLNPALARRMCLWVGAALRSYILGNYEIDPTELDDVLEEVTDETVGAVTEDEEIAEDSSVRLARGLADEGRLTVEMLVQVLRQGEIALFEALFAEMTKLRLRLVRRIVYEPGGEGLVIACRALEIEKPQFTSIFLMSRKGRPGDQRVDPEELSRVLALFDRVQSAAAQIVIRRWQRDPQYLYAIKRIEESGRRKAS
ncbi:Uncharacterized conserved protein, DUF2336 family [Tistlia consotensis]|uniref:Uncharacterized conserved protein, DUF2336 family n=2 Tax=Tistlia TaxID=1321364 RepID=A0A1Y6CUM8_9PROT|nr:Uncharacterized conserved protein, DUF2336 family [Tistlia consotensis USBA 355]SNS18226.1 Uncharacterized conserved protein, DUF2336 family [Tistlia consotensis]